MIAWGWLIVAFAVGSVTTLGVWFGTWLNREMHIYRIDLTSRGDKR